ncbi:hypothetical protein [Nonomuraea aurantiaca]|uniref:hypothetical protein n=1 Tax=Nonomuraea aurantiaca TaxID=2878562 RepID=UPI001CD9E862|nr:hypothetical protein [Nonomuraea aurantiaca]MCA2230029.1 hypothetical protein [Nonomuraea aurantiaca]
MLEPLYPDRLAEDFLALATPGHTITSASCDDWADQAPARLLNHGDDPTPVEQPLPWTGATMTVLIETSRRWPHVATTQLYPLLRAHPEVILHAGSAALAALTALPHIPLPLPLPLLELIAARLPSGRHIDLDTGIAALSTHLTTHRLAATTVPTQHAALHLAHAIRLANAGQYRPALSASQQAIDLYTELAELNRSAHLPDLATSLTNHALRLAEVGRRDEAAPVSQQAVDLYTELAELNRAAYLLAYVQSLGAQGFVLVQAEQYREAITPLLEAFVLGQDLPEHTHEILGSVLDLLREAHRQDPAEVGAEFKILTGQDFPDQLKE